MKIKESLSATREAVVIRLNFRTWLDTPIGHT
jgi:hypothetical protein